MILSSCGGINKAASAVNIHEYQAKELLREFGVPVPTGRLVTDDKAARLFAEQLGGRCVVKAQIHAGGRGKGGGVKLAQSVREAGDLTQAMLGMTLVTHQTGPAGRKVERVYIEEASDIAKELYLSFVLDRTTGWIACVVSPAGGMDIEEVAARTPDKILSLAIDPITGLRIFHSIRVADMLGLTGAPRKQLPQLLASLYQAFWEKDMSLLEINPLILTKQDALLCLDAKISFDANALFRHKDDVLPLRDEAEEDPTERLAAKQDLSYIKLDGTIGCMVNGAGLAMATMDIIQIYGAMPANFLDVGGGASKEKVTEAFKLILSDKAVQGVLVNIFGGIMRCDIIAEGILAAAQELNITVPLVVRLAGTNVEQGQAILAESDLDIIAADDLDDAAKKIVAAVGAS